MMMMMMAKLASEAFGTGCRLEAKFFGKLLEGGVTVNWFL